MSKRKPGADDFAIKQALQEQLGRTVDGKTRAQRVADALIKKAEKGQPGAVKEIQDRLLGKPAQQKQEGGLRISEETAARLATIAEKLVSHSISLSIEYAEEVQGFVASFSPEERLERGLSVTSAHALECAVRDTRVRLETQPQQTKEAGEQFRAYEPPAPPKAEPSEPDAERTVLMRQPRAAIENPDPLRDHTGELPKL